MTPDMEDLTNYSNQAKESPKKSKGLGDTIKKVTDKLGIKPCGGCGKRQDKLNRLIPYGKKGKKKK
jgi:hypothetical protein